MKKINLSEAIAEAKIVKDTAIENAKKSLEETFGPALKSMLATKLEEMEEEDDIEESKTNENDITEEVQEENLDLDEVLNNLAEVEGEEESETETETGEEEEEEEEGDDEEINIEDMTPEELSEYIEEVVGEMVEAGEIEPGDNFDSEGEENLEDTLPGAEGEEFESETEEEIMENSDLEENDPASSAAAGADAILAKVKEMIKNSPEKLSKVKSFIEDLATGASSAIKRENVQGQLQEALKTIDKLNKINKDTNLLNSKMLYTNKLMVEGDLSKERKLKIVKAIDKSETPKQAKIIYETILESIKPKVNRRRNVNEGRVRGTASASTKGLVKEDQIIQVNPVFDRFKKLAGNKW